MGDSREEEASGGWCCDQWTESGDIKAAKAGMDWVWGKERGCQGEIPSVSDPKLATASPNSVTNQRSPEARLSQPNASSKSRSNSKPQKLL